MNNIEIKDYIEGSQAYDLERMVENTREEAKDLGTLLMAEPVAPKGGDLVKEKPFDPQPVLERLSVLNASFDQLEKGINATDTSRISVREAAALNELKKAYQAANEACLQVLG